MEMNNRNILVNKMTENISTTQSRQWFQLIPHLDSVKELAELRSFLFIFDLELPKLLIKVSIFLLIQTQDTLKCLSQLFSLIFQHFLIKLGLLNRIELCRIFGGKKKVSSNQPAEPVPLQYTDSTEHQSRTLNIIKNLLQTLKNMPNPRPNNVI